MASACGLQRTPYHIPTPAAVRVRFDAERPCPCHCKEAKQSPSVPPVTCRHVIRLAGAEPSGPCLAYTPPPHPESPAFVYHVTCTEGVRAWVAAALRVGRVCGTFRPPERARDLRAGPDQLFRFSRTSGGAYMVEVQGRGLCMDASDMSWSAGVQIKVNMRWHTLCC